jgi:ent-kaurene oxidase
MLDLAENYDYINDLRSEVQEVKRLFPGPWTKQSLSQLRKMDSVLKESQRLHPTLIGAKFHQCDDLSTAFH